MFLNILNDENNRKFPVNYKFVCIKDILTETKKKGKCKIDIYNTDSYEPYPFHKPISKL